MKTPISLKGYFSLHFGLVAVLPVITIAGLLWLFMMPAVKHRTILESQAVARTLAGQISTYLDGGERQLAALAGHLKLHSSGRDHTDLLDAQCGSGEFFETLFITDDKAAAIQFVGLTPPRRPHRKDVMGLDLSGRIFINTAEEGTRPLWSNTFLSMVSSQMSVALTLPLERGFIIGELTLARLSQFIRDLPDESEFLIMVFDSRGQVIADATNLHRGVALDDLLPLSQKGKGFSAGSFVMGGEDMLGVRVEMDAAGWNVLVARQVRNVVQPFREAFRLIGWGLAAGLALAFFISWLLAGRFSSLYRFYTRAAECIARGEYNLTWPSGRTREFVQMDQALKRMAGKISRRENALVEKERLLKNLTANVPGVMFQFRSTMDHGYTFEFIGEKTIDIFGLEPTSDAMLGKFPEHIPENDRQRFLDSIADAVDRIRPWHYEGWFGNTPGSEGMWFSGNAAPQKEEDAVIFYGVLMDITWRREMESSLRLTQFCFDHAEIGIYHIMEGGRILNANEYAAKMLGYTVEELSSRIIYDIDPLVTPEKLLKLWHRLICRGADFFETVHVKKDGTRIPVEIASSLLVYEGQQFSICFVRDITERKKMELDLKNSQERLGLALSGANEGIWDWYIPEDKVYFDDRYYTLAGYKPNEFEGSFDEFLKRVHSKDIERIKSAIDRYLAGDLETYEEEFRFLHKKGRYMWIRAKGQVVSRDDQGRPLRFTGIHADITGHKEAEQELHRLRKYLSNIIDSMPSILVAVNSDGRVTLWNSRTEQATGLRYDQVRSRPLVKVFPRLADEMTRIQTAIQEHRVISSPKVPLKLAAETRFEDITIFPLVANGVEGAVIRVDDVTEQVRMEEMMIQSGKMMSVGGLAAGMAHEINNPLAGMMQTAQVMARRLQAGSHIPANQKAAQAAGITMESIEQFMENRGIQTMINTIILSGQRVSDIVNNMLSFARKDDTAQAFNSLNDILDKSIDLAATDWDLKKEYDFKRIKIIREYEENLPAVPCQASKIQQVLLNILTNGAQAMAGAGTRDAEFCIRTYTDNARDMVCMEIEDNGPGMDESITRQIFDPFFTTKPAGVGTGLGLSVSYFIITENHHGDMTVQSSPGQGAKFLIRLPMPKGRNH